jgi:pentatricopeptide repeat protein
MKRKVIILGQGINAKTLAEQCVIHGAVGQSEQLFCRDCKYDKAETYHDKMWCRDCKQKDRFTAK